MSGNRNSGRRPKPTALKLLEGNLGKRPLNRDEPKPPKGDVAKPTDLSAPASIVWDELSVAALEMRTLTPADGAAFRSLCELEATLRLESAKKGTVAFSPIREAKIAAAVRPFYDMFGLNPTGRARIRVPPTGNEKASGPIGLRAFAQAKGGRRA